MDQRTMTRRSALVGAVGAALSLPEGADAAPSSQPASPAHRACVTTEVKGQTVFGMIHRPSESDGARKRPGVAIFHGFVGNKTDPHRIFLKAATMLARACIVALRIDFRGRGDSDGETIDITPQADLEDAAAALDFLARRPDVDATRLAVIGLSWGGVVAAITAGRDPRVRAAALWSCAPEETMQWEPELRDVGGRPAAEMFGFLIGKQFYDGLRDLRPLEEIARTRARVLLVRGSDDEQVPVRAVERFEQRMRRANVHVECDAVQGADHAFMKHEWEARLLERSIPFVRDALG